MRAFCLVLAGMVLVGAANAEVVISNYASATTNRTAATSSGQFQFSGPSGRQLESIKFNIKNTGASTLTAGTDFFFGVYFPDLSTSNYLTPGSNLAANAFSDFTLDLSSFGYTTTGSNQILTVSFQTANNGSGSLINTLEFATSLSSPDVLASGWNFVTTSPQAATKDISFTLTAVPEPGTLMLGSLVACGGAGAWLRRKRKSKAEAEEAID